MQHELARRSRARQGFNLIEAAIVLGVVGLVIGGIWVAAAAVQESNRQRLAVQQVISILSNFRALYVTPPVSSVMISFLTPAILSSIFPKEMLTSTGAIATPWTTGVELTYVDGVNPRIEVRLPMGNNVSSCVSLGPKLASALSGEGNALSSKVSTWSGAYDITTPALAALNCQMEFDDEGKIDIGVIVPF